MWDLIFDAVKDSLIVLPFIFLIYFLMELIESVNKKEKIESMLGGRFAPIIASATGIVPECGFSVMCAKLFESGLIGIGTLISAFISTSDEGLVILISEGMPFLEILAVVLIKLVFAIIIGILFNFLFKKFNNVHTCPEGDDCVECGKKQERKIDKFLFHPLLHTLKMFLFLLVINLLLGVIFEFFNEELNEFIAGSIYLQPLATSVIGLIPNCASSVVIAEGYINGIIGFPALLSGLCANAGMGLLILYRNRKNWKNNILITFLTFLSGVIIGYLLLILGI